MKSLTYDQADALLAAAEGRLLHACIVVSLLAGARTGELRGPSRAVHDTPSSATARTSLFLR
ncbi:MAG: hypothetical protein ACR2MP_31670 [Streptosporangiaceae bacterium]